MGKVYVLALLMAGILCGSIPRQEKAGVATAAPASEGSIRVTIETGGGLYGPVKSRFKVGETIPVVISLANTGDSAAKYCLSTDLFQDRPRLSRDGQVIPYLTTLTTQADQPDLILRCENSAARKFYQLQPRQKRIVDWFTIGQRGIAWYPRLAPGHYELVLMRRVECCQGPLVESNKVAFEVVP
ncbi:MAG: hypothetical protein ACJ741_18075 [Pyrinomonadaceae bacterium]